MLNESFYNKIENVNHQSPNSVLCIFSDTTAAFWAQETLWPGVYRITVEVFDAEGLSCPDKQTVEVQVCTCDEGGDCSLRAAQQTGSSWNVGLPAIALMFLALALILCKSRHTNTEATRDQDVISVNESEIA